jgi:hypothetical protein
MDEYIFKSNSEEDIQKHTTLFLTAPPQTRQIGNMISNKQKIFQHTNLHNALNKNTESLQCMAKNKSAAQRK